jgi:glycosyltransferase involved in cell wall biosynthesis
MEKPFRILRVVGRLDRGGLETIIMNAYRIIDREELQFDFVMHTTDECHYSEEIRRLGGKIFSVPSYTGKNHFEYIKAWKKFFQEHPEYNVVHGHMMSTASIYLNIAKKFGLTTISHSHATQPNNKLRALQKYFLQSPLRKKNNGIDYMFACSEAAGQWLFGNNGIKKDNFRVVPNGIDVEKFAFSTSTREKMRKDLNLKDQFVVGHIGRFDSGKNHKFIILIFNELVRLKPDAKLILVGDGALKSQVEDQVKENNLSDKVIFTGVRDDVNDLIQAMDIFLFPSLFEGFGNVLIEAQSSGLPCLVSNSVQQEVRVTDLVHFISLEKSSESWAQKIVEVANNFKRIDTSQNVISAGYDVNRIAKWYQEFYLSFRV